jgi:hypothetical protein
MTTIRQWHSYLGLFIAPSVLFFALTGSLQIFSLHEAHDGYKPLAIIEKLAKVHKDQVFAAGHHHDAEAPVADATGTAPPGTSPAVAAESAPADDDDKPALPTVLLKYFFLLVALCLMLSTAFGLWMALKYTRRKRLAWTLLIAGTVIPVGLLII